MRPGAEKIIANAPNQGRGNQGKGNGNRSPSIMALVGILIGKSNSFGIEPKLTSIQIVYIYVLAALTGVGNFS